MILCFSIIIAAICQASRIHVMQSSASAEKQIARVKSPKVRSKKVADAIDLLRVFLLSSAQYNVRNSGSHVFRNRASSNTTKLFAVAKTLEASRMTRRSIMTDQENLIVDASTRLAEWNAKSMEASLAGNISVVCTTDELPRVTKFISQSFDSMSVKGAKKAFKSQRVFVNCMVCELTRRLKEGDVVTITPPQMTLASDEDVQRRLTFATGVLKSGQVFIVYEEDELAVVSKPAFLHTKPYKGKRSLEEILPCLLTPPKHSSDALQAPVAVHRLDARVSGLVVIAKTSPAAVQLSEAFAKRSVIKRYRAIALGRMDKSVVQRTTPIDGRLSNTSIRVIEWTPHKQAGTITTLDLYPHTGRKHQLRIHCAELGHPLLGDDLYKHYLNTSRANTSTLGMTLNGQETKADDIDKSFFGKQREGLFLQSVEISFEFNGRQIHAKVPEASKFARMRKRARLGVEYDSTVA